jgi:hypothetical protein
MFGFSGNAAVGSAWVSQYTNILFSGVPEQYTRAGVWTSFTSQATSVNVGFGNTVGSLSTISATSFQMPGNADIAILRLATRVPATTAIPVAVVESAPPLAGQFFTLAGWGTDATGGVASVRQIGLATGGASMPVTFGPLAEYHRIVVSSLAGDAVGMPGDSGGPLFRIVNGARVLVGVFNQGGGIYQALWVNSTDDSLGYAHPNTAAWVRAAIR